MKDCQLRNVLREVVRTSRFGPLAVAVALPAATDMPCGFANRLVVRQGSRKHASQRQPESCHVMECQPLVHENASRRMLFSSGRRLKRQSYPDTKTGRAFAGTPCSSSTLVLCVGLPERVSMNQPILTMQECRLGLQMSDNYTRSRRRSVRIPTQRLRPV